jgi:hypothetical protein
LRTTQTKEIMRLPSQPTKAGLLCHPSFVGKENRKIMAETSPGINM